jgi:hypothetical protein
VSVVNFPKREEPDAIWVCNCGCASFELHADGRATCRDCRSVADEGGWKVRADGDVSYDGMVTYSDAGNGGEFAERKIKRDVQSAEWIICGTWSGRIMSWSDSFIETPDQEAWLREHVEIGLTEILKDKP